MAAHIRGLGIRLVIYFYDLLILNNSISDVLCDLRIVIDFFNSLGLIINFQKSIIDPQQKIEYLSMIIDSNALQFSLPVKKVNSIRNLCENAYAKTYLGKSS